MSTLRPTPSRARAWRAAGTLPCAVVGRPAAAVRVLAFSRRRSPRTCDRIDFDLDAAFGVHDDEPRTRRRRSSRASSTITRSWGFPFSPAIAAAASAARCSNAALRTPATAPFRALHALPARKRRRRPHRAEDSACTSSPRRARRTRISSCRRRRPARSPANSSPTGWRCTTTRSSRTSRRGRASNGTGRRGRPNPLRCCLAHRPWLSGLGRIGSGSGAEDRRAPEP